MLAALPQLVEAQEAPQQFPLPVDGAFLFSPPGNSKEPMEGKIHVPGRAASGYKYHPRLSGAGACFSLDLISQFWKDKPFAVCRMIHSREG